MPEMNREEIAKLEALYASNPEGRVFTHLAEAYRKAGDFDRARRILQQGLTRHPGYASAYVVLGRVQQDMGESEAAEESFRRVLELDPHNLVALRSLGDIARAAGRREQALGYFEELRHQDPGNDEVERFIAELRQAAPAPEASETEAAPAAPETRDFGESPPIDQRTAEAAPESAPVESAAPEFEAASPEAVPEEASEPAPAAAPEIEVEYVQEEEELEIIGALEDLAAAEPDFGDLVTPDIELNWEGGEPSTAEEQALPGDLANFAGLNAHLEIRDENNGAEPEPPPPEEVPELHFPDVGEPADIDAELQAAEAESEAGGGDVVTETMAQLYRDQGLYERAAEVYRQLLKERPYDAELQRGLGEVEALAAIIGSDQTAPESEPEDFDVELEPPGETAPPEDAPFPFQVTAPEAAEPPAAAPSDLAPADESAEREDEVESPWMTPQSAAPETPNPYTWTEEQPEADVGQPINAYFRDLLAWRPARTTAAPAATAGAFAAPTSSEPEAEPEPEPEIANFAAAPELEAQPAVLELTTPVEPPAIPADELMPWEEPASPSMPGAAVTPPPTAPSRPGPRAGESGKDPVEAAFDEWFTAAEPSSQPAPPAPAPPSPPPAAPAADSSDSDDDDDLEMFRSWLQSLKK